MEQSWDKLECFRPLSISHLSLDLKLLLSGFIFPPVVVTSDHERRVDVLFPLVFVCPVRIAEDTEVERHFYGSRRCEFKRRTRALDCVSASPLRSDQAVLRLYRLRRVVGLHVDEWSSFDGG